MEEPYGKEPPCCEAVLGISACVTAFFFLFDARGARLGAPQCRSQARRALLVASFSHAGRITACVTAFLFRVFEHQGAGWREGSELGRCEVRPSAEPLPPLVSV